MLEQSLLVSCECKMLNTHNSLIIREQQNKVEAPADSPNFNEQQTFVCCFFCCIAIRASTMATTKIAPCLKQVLLVTPRTFSLNAELRGGKALEEGLMQNSKFKIQNAECKIIFQLLTPHQNCQ